MSKISCCLKIQGAVQGVGFRPFIYRLATELNLVGWVNNSAQGVMISVEGDRALLETFIERIKTEKPPASFIQSLEINWAEIIGYENFEIRPSLPGTKTAIVLADLATCPDCFAEIFDPENRRYRYPFTNCTNCGPRYTIIESVPYDRPATTMKKFDLCSDCEREYHHPSDRRFHAQPNACPQCGPHLELWDKNGDILQSHDRALMATVAAIREGKIVAIKGLGGFHLMVDAHNEAAVQRLREKKHRPDKPFALMYPSLAKVQGVCEVSEIEADLLRSPQAPIVLLRLKNSGKNNHIAPAVSPGNPYLGIMLPYTPLHHLLMAELGDPVVATSGNLADEPICTDEAEAIARLGNIADLFLVHNRPIARPVDDSVVRVVSDRLQVIRRARGYAPLPVFLPKFLQAENGQSGKDNGAEKSGTNLLAVGGHFKNAIAILMADKVFLSQHIGDMETPQAFDAFQTVIKTLGSIYDFQPDGIACDAHPDYISSQYARSQSSFFGLPVFSVQHHYAHVLACMAENQIEPPVLGISWDGTGYGLDGTIWGGEFLAVSDRSFQRVAHWRTFRLPGGEKAVKEPRRVALGLLYELFGADFDDGFNPFNPLPLQDFSPRELQVIKTMLQKQLNAPLTSSMGRLFDAIAALIGLRQTVTFEGQGAMELEFILSQIDEIDSEINPINRDAEYSFKIENNLENLPNQPLIVDWQPMIREILADLRFQQPIALISLKFHNTLVAATVAIAKQIGIEKIALTGGCFQNKYLTERMIQKLTEANFRPYWHQWVPPNDGGLALGQIIAALREPAVG